jgi:hypothetical protein
MVWTLKLSSICRSLEMPFPLLLAKVYLRLSGWILDWPCSPLECLEGQQKRLRLVRWMVPCQVLRDAASDLRSWALRAQSKVEWTDLNLLGEFLENMKHFMLFFLFLLSLPSHKCFYAVTKKTLYASIPELLQTLIYIQSLFGKAPIELLDWIKEELHEIVFLLRNYYTLVLWSNSLKWTRRPWVRKSSISRFRESF